MKTITRKFVEILKGRLLEEGGLMQVVLGPRQVGKTTGVKQCMEALGKPYRYASADERFLSDTNWLQLEWQQAQLLPEGSVFVIDEVQKVEEWQSVLKYLWDNRNAKHLKVVVLGSSSLEIQQGMKETMAGRYELIPVMHWTYPESREMGLTLQEWILMGGYPGSYAFLKDEARWQSYLQNSILENVLSKDVFRVRTLSKPALFRQFIEIVRAYPCQEISYTKLLGALQDHGNVELVKTYLHLLECSYLYKGLEKYSRKEYLKKSSSPKILPLSPALCTFSGSVEAWLEPDAYGRLFELAVGATLAQLPGKLYYWREKNDEVDFVYEGKRLFAVEVKSVQHQKASGLSAFQKHFPNAVPVLLDPESIELFLENPAEYLSAMV